MLIPRITPPTRPGRRRGGPTDLRQQRHALVGRLADLRHARSEEQRCVRAGEGGKLRLAPTTGCSRSRTTRRSTRPLMPGFWIGLAHDADPVHARAQRDLRPAARRDYPHWDDDELFQRARLVIAALLAKIHTVEWTPAIISHPTTVTALRANWFGLAGERIARRASAGSARSEVISGIPGSETEHYGVPYSLTEEFAAVYRMHPLLPDDYEPARRRPTTAAGASCTFRDARRPDGVEGDRDELRRWPTSSTPSARRTPARSCCTTSRGSCRSSSGRTASCMDLAATDILRIRELGVPRYNEFRRLLHLKPAGDFEDLTDDRGLAAEIARRLRRRHRAAST